MTYPYPTRQQEIKQQKIFAHNYMVILGVRTYVPPLLANKQKKVFIHIQRRLFLSSTSSLLLAVSVSGQHHICFRTLLSHHLGPVCHQLLLLSAGLQSPRSPRLVHADPDVAQKQLVTSILILYLKSYIIDLLPIFTLHYFSQKDPIFPFNFPLILFHELNVSC